MAQAKEVRGPGPRMGGPRPKVENPGKLLKRIMDEVFRHYLPHCILVLVCIVVSALANVQASLFLKTLMDDYIVPMTQQQDPDFAPLAAALLRVGIIYVIGILAAWLNARIMVNVTQGTLRNLRVQLFRLGLAQHTLAHNGHICRGNMLQQPADSKAHEIQHLVLGAGSPLDNPLKAHQLHILELIVQPLMGHVVVISHLAHIGLFSGRVLGKIAAQILDTLPHHKQAGPLIDILGILHRINNLFRNPKQLSVVLIDGFNSHVIVVGPFQFHRNP